MQIPIVQGLEKIPEYSLIANLFNYRDQPIISVELVNKNQRLNFGRLKTKKLPIMPISKPIMAERTKFFFCLILSKPSQIWAANLIIDYVNLINS